MTPLRQLRIGMLTPSSNTRLEPVCQQMLDAVEGVSVHFTRVPVVSLSLGEESQQQFSIDTMTRAARLLGDCDVDVVAWNGTSGSWLGLDHDRKTCAAITEATGKPATTSSLALFRAFEALKIDRVGLAVPYVGDLTAQIIDTYAQEGVACVESVWLNLEDNLEIGALLPEQVDQLVRDAHVQSAQAVAVVCTNVDAATRTRTLEAELDLPVLDSIAVTVWDCLRIVGNPGYGLAKRWGQLFSRA